MKKESVKIIEFRGRAIKALKAVQIKPGDKPVVKLTGRNRQGKSSILDAIWMALGGKSCIPSKPIRDGAEEAEAYLDLGEFTVSRKITRGGEYLQVQTKDGFKASKPQEFLSSRLGNRARNPLQFMALKPDEQVKALQGMVKIQVDPKKFESITGLPIKGIDFESDPVAVLDQAYKHLYQQRTEINREVARIEGVLKTIIAQIPPGSENVQPVSAVELFKERSALNAEKEANDKKRTALESEQTKLLSLGELAERIHNEVIDLQQQIAKLQEQRAGIIAEYQDLEGAIAGASIGVAQLVDPDFTDIDARIAGVDEANRIANLIKQHESESLLHGQTVDRALTLSNNLTMLKLYKTELISASGLPVPGLGFENGEVTFNGFPLSQASTREQIEISCAICAAENPAIGILTVDIGFAELDKEGQEALTDFARDRDLQIWITKVSEEPEAEGFHIYSGEVVAIDGVAVGTPEMETPIPSGEMIPAIQPEMEAPSWMSNA